MRMQRGKRQSKYKSARTGRRTICAPPCFLRAFMHEKIDILKERELLALTEAVRHLSLQLEALSQKVH
jgi:hypothetical protein